VQLLTQDPAFTPVSFLSQLITASPHAGPAFIASDINGVLVELINAALMSGASPNYEPLDLRTPNDIANTYYCLRFSHRPTTSLSASRTAPQEAAHHRVITDAVITDTVVTQKGLLITQP
jgi:hypothetical protein